MESLFLHCRTFGLSPHGLVVYEKKEKAPKTASEKVEKPLDGRVDVNRSLETTAIATSQTVEKAELASEVSLQKKLEDTWKMLPAEKKRETQWSLDQIDWSLRALDVYRDEEHLAKNKGEIFEAVRKYETAAQYFNQEAGTNVFPERLGDPIFKKPGDLKKEERRDEAFDNAKIIQNALEHTNFTDNPKLGRGTSARTDGKKVETTVLTKADLQGLSKAPMAQLRTIVAEVGKTKKLQLTITDCRELVATDLAAVKDPVVEKKEKGHEEALDQLRAVIIMYAWDEHVAPLIRLKDGKEPKFDLRPNSRFGEMISPNVEEQYRLKGHVFELAPKPGSNPSPEEVKKAQEVEEFLHKNWKDIVFMRSTEPELVPMQQNIDVQRNNRDRQQRLADVRNVPEWEAMKKQPFSRTIMSSPSGILLTILGYIFLDKEDKGLLTKFLLGSFGVEKMGGTEGLTAMAHQLGDKVPWAKKWIEDVMGGQLNLKAKEATRNVFESWTGLSGVRQDTRDWMLRDSDGLSSSKKLGMYVMFNDLTIEDIKRRRALPKDTNGSIGAYIKEWQVQGKGAWWDTTGGYWDTVKKLGQKLGTSSANAAGKGEGYVEKFLYGGIMDLSDQDVDLFFKEKIEDTSGKAVKPNMLHEVLVDGRYDKDQLETALRKRSLETSSSAAASGAVSSTASGAPALTTAPNRVPPLTKPSEATKGEEFFDHALAGMASISDVVYDDKEPDWFNVDFKKGTTTYHALKNRKEPGEGLWVEALKTDGSSDSGTYSLFFPDLATLKGQFDRTVEIMGQPDGKKTLQKLFNDGLGKLPAGSWTIDRIDLPADANISAKDGWFNAEIKTNTAAPNDKLKLYALAGGEKFQVTNAKGELIQNGSTGTEFESGAELDTVLRLGASTIPPVSRETPTEGDPKDQAYMKINETLVLIKNGNLENPDKRPVTLISDKPLLAGKEYFIEIKIGNQPFNLSIPAGRNAPINVFIPKDEGKNVHAGNGLDVTFPDYATLREELVKNVILQERVQKTQQVRDSWLRLSNGLPGWLYLSPTGQDDVLYAKEVSGTSPSLADKTKGYWKWSALAPKQAQDLTTKYSSQVYDVK